MTTTVGGVRVKIALGDTWNDTTPTFVDITALSGCRVRSFSIDRGRADEFAKTGTGTATLRIVDREGLFDPTNGSSPYFGDVLPDKQATIELYNPVLAEWQTIFTGFTEEWSFVLDVTRQFFEVTVSLVDGFAPINDYQLTPGVDGDATPTGSEGRVFYENTLGSVKDRIDALLDDAGWPDPPLRDVFSGNVRVTETLYEAGHSALAAIFDAADAEFPGVANCYMTREGVFTFHGRQPRFRPDVADYGINRRDVGDPSVTDLDATICPIHELGYDLGKANLYNSVLAYPQDTTVGVPITDAEVSAQVNDTYRVPGAAVKTLQFVDLLTIEGIATGNTALQETKLIADYFADNYHDPLPRINRMVFKTRPSGHRLAGPLWKMLTRVEISDLLTLTTAHPGGGGFSAEEFYVEGIHYNVTPGGPSLPVVVLTLDVSPKALFDVNPFDADEDPGT